MNIRNVGNSGNVDRSLERSQRSDRGASQAPIQSRGGDGDRDDADISVSGRETAARVEGLAERARRDGADRQEKVEAARARLQSGELDGPQVLADTARKLLGDRFLGV